MVDNQTPRVVLYLTILVTLAVGVQTTGAAVKLVLQGLIGVMIAHGVELTHQCVHRTAFRHKKLETVLGTLLSLPALRSFTIYRYAHLRHHRLNGATADGEWAQYAEFRSPKRLRRVIALLKHLTLFKSHITAIRRILIALTPNAAKRLAEDASISAEHAKRVAVEYRLSALLLGFGGFCAATQTSVWLVDLWLVPLLIGYGPAHALIVLPEHLFCDRGTNSLSNTRSIRAGPFARWLTHFNCCHTGHHVNASIPFERLPSFERDLISAQAIRFLSGSYLSCYVMLARRIWRGGTHVAQ